MTTQQSFSWGYDAHNGPHTWAKLCDHAAGSSQSPVNIVTSRTSFDESLAENALHLTDTASKSMTLVNTGRAFQVRLNSDVELSGGPLKYKYKFAQFHMHWGSHGAWGSEHVINGQPGAAELHFVFWNAEKYADFDDACVHHDGLSVLGVILQEGADNAAMEPLFRHFDAIKHADTTADQLPPINMEKLLPANRSEYFTYFGSLTTPPCTECVTWIVFKEMHSISEGQLSRCRQLYSTKATDEETLTIDENYRTPCPVGKRVIRKSFK